MGVCTLSDRHCFHFWIEVLSLHLIEELLVSGWHLGWLVDAAVVSVAPTPPPLLALSGNLCAVAVYKIWSARRSLQPGQTLVVFGVSLFSLWPSSSDTFHGPGPLCVCSSVLHRCRRCPRLLPLDPIHLTPQMTTHLMRRKSLRYLSGKLGVGDGDELLSRSLSLGVSAPHHFRYSCRSCGPMLAVLSWLF